MNRSFFNTFLLILVSVIFQRCAQVVPLSGGERDQTAPNLIGTLPALPSVNFNSEKIILIFNEFVQLRDLKNQLLVSPRLKTDPEIVAEGKKVIIQLKKDELLPNTTYKIYFGKAIVDVTENNAMSNFSYVFSTGPFIDSLKVQGKIIDAITLTEINDAVVGLYSQNLNKDSLPFVKVPDYLTRSKEGGSFQFENLPAGKFKLVAFEDKNKNYLFDAANEKIGFTDSLIQPGKDSLLLNIFSEKASKVYIKKVIAPYYGVVNVIYNQKVQVLPEALIKTQHQLFAQIDPDKERDTVTFFYKDIKDTLKLVLNHKGTMVRDTLNAALPKLNERRKKTTLYKLNIDNGTLQYNQKLMLEFNAMPDTIKRDSLKMRLRYKKDSVIVNEKLKLHFIWPGKAIVKNKLPEGTEFIVHFDTAALYDASGRYNDSLNINFKTQSKTDLGQIKLNMRFFKKQNYVVQLINSKGNVYREEFLSLSLSSSNEVKLAFDDVIADNYFVKVIFDNNGNNKWDTGEYLRKMQPERIFISTKQLKAISDWEIEEEIVVK